MDVKGISPDEEKQIAIFKFDDKGKIKTYTHIDQYKTITNEQYQQLRKNPRSSTHLLLRKNDKDENFKLLSMKDQMIAFDIEAKILKIITNGKINLYKTVSIAKTGLLLFYSTKPPIPEKIQDFEGTIFESCFLGALIFGIPYKGKSYKYDFCSHYPAIMKLKSMQFPIGVGKLVKLNSEDVSKMKYFKYGIYHVKITGIDYRLLKENKKNYYTHIDINRALELNYKVELIEDDKPNALLYEGKLINGHKLFSEYIDYLFKFKNQGFHCIKRYINCLWGMLSQIDILTINTKSSPIINENKEILTFLPVGPVDNVSHLLVDICKPSKRYETDFARIKPFLVAKGRYVISKVIEKNLDNVVYVHTDSVILTKPIKDVKLGSNIGELKFEEFVEECEIINGNTKKGFTYNKEQIITKLNKQLELAYKLYPKNK